MAMPNNKVQNREVFANLITCLGEIEDPRVEKKSQYPLDSILLMALCAMLGGSNNWVEVAVFCCDHKEWFEDKLEIECGIPSHDTFNRVFNLIRPKDLVFWLSLWMENCLPENKSERAIHIDGKGLSGYSACDSLVLVQAWSEQTSCIIGSVKMPRKSNEINTIPRLLNTLYLSGAIVTIDAIGMQKTIVDQIVSAGGDYVIALKKNHKLLYNDVALFIGDTFAKELNVKHSYARTIEKNHGRIEERQCYATQQLGWLDQKKEWKKLCSIIAVKTKITWCKTGKKSCNIRYYVSSMKIKAEQFLSIIRSHWSIENKLHWPLDRYLDEDRSTINDAYGAQNSSFFRSTTVALLQRAQKTLSNRSIPLLRQTANRQPNFLLSTLLNWA